jgi:hypothetical protein
MNPEEFNQELDNISSAAGKYDILCICYNHQWECSSYICEGIGFPNSLLIGSFEPHSAPSGRPSRQDLKFWNGWWDRKMETIRGKDGWDAQLEFLEGAVKRLKIKILHSGFEILNEPRYSDRSILKR